MRDWFSPGVWSSAMGQVALWVDGLTKNELIPKHGWWTERDDIKNFHSGRLAASAS